MPRHIIDPEGFLRNVEKIKKEILKVDALGNRKDRARLHHSCGHVSDENPYEITWASPNALCDFAVWSMPSGNFCGRYVNRVLLSWTPAWPRNEELMAKDLKEGVWGGPDTRRTTRGLYFTMVQGEGAKGAQGAQGLFEKREQPAIE